MIIERTKDEIVVRIPANIDICDVQRLIDWFAYKEANAQCKAEQEDIDALARESKKGWWTANRNQNSVSRVKI